MGARDPSLRDFAREVVAAIEGRNVMAAEQTDEFG